MVSVRSHFLGWASRKKNKHCTTVGCHVAKKCQWNLDFVCDSCYSRFRSDASINFDCRYSVCPMRIATFVRVAEVMVGWSLIGVVVAPLPYVRTVMSQISIFPLGVGAWLVIKSSLHSSLSDPENNARAGPGTVLHSLSWGYWIN